MPRIVNIAQRRLKGDKVPRRKKYSAALKVMSNGSFTVERGPLELEYQNFLSQSRSKFILDYCVCKRNKYDTEPLEQMRPEERLGKGSLKEVHAGKDCRDFAPFVTQPA